MALTVQNLRAVGNGVEPASLLPGQICFNITDKVLYVGDGSSFKTSFDGTQVPGVPGEGWYAMPMDFASLGDYYVANPLYYGDVPTDQQVLTWSTALNHPIWTSGGGGGGGGQVYVVTNAAVAAAPGTTTSDKITAAIGVASPDEGDTTIVTGLPDDVYEGLYFFTTEWVKGAAYAYPSASEVIYDNTVTGLTPTVQGAIDDLDAAVQAATSTANTANSTANSALSIANAALPKAGGTMTGAIVAQNINVQSGFSLQFAGGVSGSVNAISDSISLTSSTTAASSTAVRSAYLLAQAALPYAGGAMTGTITFAVGQTFPVSGIQDATPSQKGVVQIGTNVQVASGTISILNSTTAQKGVVQLNDTLSSSSTTLALTARAGKDLQDQINSITLASSVTLAGSLDASTGLLDSVTTQGSSAGFTAGAALPAPAAGNADYYVLVTVAGSYSPPGGGGPFNAENGDWFLSDGANWQYLGVGARPQSASYTTAGIVQLADTAVTYTGTSDTEAVTPNSLQDKLSDSTSLADSNRIASSTAVKAAYDLAAAAIPRATATAKGDLLAATAPGSIIALPVGSNGQVLVANSACATGLEWVSDTPGDVTSVTGNLPITVDNTDPQNPVVDIIAGSTVQPGAVQLNDTVTSTDITQAATANAAKTAYDAGVQGQADAANALSVANAAVPCASFTTPGELLSGTGTGTYAALSPGSDGQVLIADSTCGEGLKWGNACYVPDSAYTALGDIVVGTAANTYTALPVGADGAIILADSTCPEGMRWAVCNSLNLLGTTCGVGQAPYTTALGYNAADAVSATAFYNVAIGYESGGNITAGDYNVGVGSFTLQGTGSNNTAVGHSSQGSTASTGQGNSSVGYQSLDALTSGQFNSALGHTAGTSVTSGTRNTLIGYRAGALLTTGIENTIVGAYEANQTLSCHVVLANGNGDVKFQANGNGAWSPDGTNYGTVGQVLTSNGTVAAPTWSDIPPTLTGYTEAATPFNTALGTNAGDSITTGTDNVALGYNAGTAQAAGAQSVFVGSGAGQSTNATGVIAIGFCAAQANTTAGCGTYLGFVSGRNATGLSNTYIGALTGCAASNTSACGTLLGFCAGSALTTGNGNNFMGFQAGRNVNTGGFNVAIGTASFQTATTAANNVAIGCGALAGLSTSCGNVAVGHRAMINASTAADNVVIGCGAGTQISTGSCNVAMGFSALNAAATSGNVAIGAFAGAATTSGNNTVIGFCAGASLTNTSQNVFIGYLAGRGVTTGQGNIGIGCGAMVANNAGSSNIAIGFSAGEAMTAAGNNTFIGPYAGRGVTTGSSNVFLGFYSGTATQSNNIVLADGSGNVRFQANSTGAWSPNGTNYGISGQILSSTGTGSAPAWTSSLPQVTPPTASTDAGVQGQIASDSTYFYMYTGGRWQRVAWDVTIW